MGAIFTSSMYESGTTMRDILQLEIAVSLIFKSILSKVKQTCPWWAPNGTSSFSHSSSAPPAGRNTAPGSPQGSSPGASAEQNDF